MSEEKDENSPVKKKGGRPKGSKDFVNNSEYDSTVTKTRKRKRSVFRWSKDKEEELLMLVAEGMEVSEIYQSVHNMPHPRDVSKRAKENKDFAEKLNESYTSLLMIRQGELEKLSKTPAIKAFPDVTPACAEKTKQLRLKALEFQLKTLAPIWSTKFSTTQKVEHSGKLDNQLIVKIQPYAQLDKGVTIEHK